MPHPLRSRVVVVSLLAALAVSLPGGAGADDPADARPGASGGPTPPAVPDRFPDDGNPSHVLLVIDTRTGEIVRAEPERAAEDETFPPGTAARFLFALAGLEERAFAPDETVACDSTCWAGGSHGPVDLATALALSCDAWFHAMRPRLDGATLRRHARRIGFGPDVPSAAAIDASGAFPGPGWGITARAWVDLWRALPDGTLGKRPETTSTLLAGAATAVSSPRGTARTLADPTRRVRALVGEAPPGAWVVGWRTVRATPPWAFALWLRQGTGALAAERADHLLRETIRVRERSTAERLRREPRPIPLDER